MKKIAHNLELGENYKVGILGGFYAINTIYTKQSDNLNYIILH